MLSSSRVLMGLSAGAIAASIFATAPAGAKVEGDTITLGAALSETGNYATAGKHTRNGYELAVKLINDRGGVQVGGKSYKLQVKYYDDESTAARTAELIERLIQQDGIQFILGPYGSGPTTAMAPIVEKYGVPMIEANGASRGIFNKGYRYVFAVLSTSDQYLTEAITLAAEKARESGRDPATLKIAIAVENDPFSLDVRAGIIEDAARFGMSVIIDDKLPPELNDMTATLTKVRALKPDVLVVSGHSKGAALVTRQLTEQRVEVPMLAITHCESANVTDEEKFGKNAEHTLCAAQWAPSMAYSDKWFGSAAQFTQAFQAAYDYVPPYQAAESAAAVLIYVDAIERAGEFDKDAVRDAIAATDIETFYGRVQFDSSGKNIAKPMILRQIQDGKYVPVAPTAFAAGKYQERTGLTN